MAPFPSNERRCGIVLRGKRGVRGGVGGSIDRFVAIAPRRCRVLEFAFDEKADPFGIMGVLTASGIFDCLIGGMGD